MYWAFTPLELHTKRWYRVYFLLGLSVVTLAWLVFSRGKSPELLVSGVGAVAGFMYFIYRQHLDETKLFKELFVEFNGRYSELNEQLNAIILGPQNNDLSSSDREHLFRYFNLCAEEYFFYQAGYIDHKVWLSWKKGMKIFFGHPHVRALWKSESETSSYYGFSPD
jgi:hypothetical protein